jgi:chromosome condensin MukBEF MukE localization factor
VRYFLTNENADPNCLDSKGRHPLHDLHPDGSVEVAEHIRKRLAIAEMLFAFGADISTLDMRRNMLLRDFLEAWRSYKSRAHFVGTVFD